MTLPIFVPLAYLLGATPTSFWIGRGVYGIDLRRHGSGNLGATNAFRVLGVRAALPVLLIDIAKGWIPAAFFAGWAGASPDSAWPLAFGGAAIMGHVFSPWVGFRGGKGVATSAGVLAALAPVAALVCFVGFAVVTAFTRMVSAGSVAAALLLTPAILFTPTRGGRAFVAFAVLLATFVIWAHRANIGRIVRGEESQLGVRDGGAGEAS
ncbi:MAG: glycerol-3-phosphate 1-O-acyltransferase PlsY [Longimicrobiales bacterium]|nr:glycerol-3-phosphate 1-O-acyltransferase PlsY [Longimicrobiales bacterium]